ncbi:SCO family protein [Bacteriovoracaceae bacterium]|nr:SCO family protein [Bacteriovoracaceae bacterium]
MSNAQAINDRSKKINKYIFPVVVAIVCVSLVILFKKKRVENNTASNYVLPTYYRIPPFKLLSSDGTMLDSRDLKGKVYAVNFHFTSCQTICYKVMDKSKKLQDRVLDHQTDLQILSITVDPEYDTPGILSKKASELGAKKGVWHFLTSDYDSIKNLLMNGFKMPIGKKMRNAEDVYDIAHSGKFILVDHNQKVRGFFENMDELYTSYLRIKTEL